VARAIFPHGNLYLHGVAPIASQVSMQVSPDAAGSIVTDLQEVRGRSMSSVPSKSQRQADTTS